MKFRPQTQVCKMQLFIIRNNLISGWPHFQSQLAAVFKHWGSETNVRREEGIWTQLLIVLTCIFGDTSIPAG